MDLPRPPNDPEMKNIIDKLAQFVARNGPEFEVMTKQKQEGNPKFGFLFGGEHFGYYTFKVRAEQQIQRSQLEQIRRLRWENCQSPSIWNIGGTHGCHLSSRGL